MFENENDDINNLESTMASFAAIDWEGNIDTNVSMTFSMSLSIENNSRHSSNVSFCNAMGVRGEIYKLSTSIGSLNIYSRPYSVFDIGKPSF